MFVTEAFIIAVLATLFGLALVHVANTLFAEDVTSN